MGNKTFCDVLGVGKVKIFLPTGKSLYLSDVFFALVMRRSVIFVSQLAMNGFKIKFKDKEVTISMCGQVLVNGFLSDKLYLLDTLNNEIKSSSNYFVCVNVCMDGLVMLCHMRLGHINKNRIIRMVRDGL